MNSSQSHSSKQSYAQQIDNDTLPESIESALLIAYRSTGLGLYGASIRYVGMPLEKIALYMNSAQVSGNNQLRQAIELTFQDGARRSFMAPFKVVGPASIFAWFLQYSVMGMVFQVCDKALSTSLGVPVMPYGNQLMEDPSHDDIAVSTTNGNDSTQSLRMCAKVVLAPFLSGILESTVANRAEVQRYYGINKFSTIESSLKWNPISRLCGPAFFANASRNTIMSATSFVITPVLYRQYYPQEQKSKQSLFWFGLGVNIFIGNSIAITQQALWGRALDYAASPNMGNQVATNIHYKDVIQQGLAKEGTAAFITVPKWASRVLMNAPVQGTLPWFYNEILPLAEDSLIGVAKSVYHSFMRPNPAQIKKFRESEDIAFHSTEPQTTATSPIQHERV